MFRGSFPFMARTVDRPARRAALVSAAARAFAARGVENTAVSDIVKAAAVAQGTFYLYFKSKDEIVLAVVDRIAGEMFAAIETAIAGGGSTAVQKFRALRDVLVRSTERGNQGLVDFIHRRENVALHDRLAEHFLPRLVTLVEAVIAQGVAEGCFDVPDARAAAWFVVGGLRTAEQCGVPAAEMPRALEAATELALRALGHEERGA